MGLRWPHEDHRISFTSTSERPLDIGCSH